MFPKSRKLAYDIRQQLSQVQNHSLDASELFLSIDELHRQLDIMCVLVKEQTIPTQRDVWNRKIFELREDANSIKRQGQSYYDRMISANVREKKQRDELMTLRHRRNKHNTSDAENAMNDLTEESESLANSQSLVGELLLSGQTQLNALIHQRNQMRGIKRLVITMGQKVGLSNATMRMIERRDTTDAYFVFAGMFLTILVIYLLYFRWR